MANTLTRQIESLRQMTVTQLKDKYLQLFGEPTRSGNKDFLCKRLAWRIQSLAEGDLSERARRRAEELARDADIRLTIPRSAELAPKTVTAPLRSDGRVPLPGTVLTRRYKGRTIQVTVLADGFEHDGTRYRSLSAIAKAITGTQWNGLLFFGLKESA
jgi:hypothetical protein